MSHFEGHFEGAKTFLTPEIVPQKKFMSRSFLNSGTLIVIRTYQYLFKNSIPFLLSMLRSGSLQVVQGGSDISGTLSMLHRHIIKNLFFKFFFAKPSQLFAEAQIRK
jgi:hypothetical protein